MAQLAMRPRMPSETFLRDAEAANAVRDRLQFLLGYGALARGPWTVAMGETAIDFRLGHRCNEKTPHASHREVLIGCGIGLAELRLALRQIGCVDSTILLPEESEPDLLARVYIDQVERDVNPESFVLCQALAAPVSTRSPRTIDGRFQQELAAITRAERASLSFSYELPMAESSATCGAPSLGSVARRVTWLESNAAPSIGSPEDRNPGEFSFEWSVGAVIATKGDRVADWLCAGQALARVALRARVEGLFTCVEGAANGAQADGSFAHVALRMGVPRSYEAERYPSPMKQRISGIEGLRRLA